ncbi:MAG: hypothetical protein WKF40_04940 [Thermoleophilaceae bacterium]
MACGRSGPAQDDRGGGRAVRRAPAHGQAAKAHDAGRLRGLPAPAPGAVLRRADGGPDRAADHVEAYMRAKLATARRRRRSPTT